MSEMLSQRHGEPEPINTGPIVENPSVEQTAFANDLLDSQMPNTLENPTPIAEPTEYVGRHRAIEDEAQNQGRFSARVANRIASLAERFSANVSDRRTTKELAAEKLDAGRAIARRVGGSIVKEVRRTKDDITDNLRDLKPVVKDIGKDLKGQYDAAKEYGLDKKEALRSKLTARAERAQARKLSRMEARAIRNEQKALDAENKQVKKQVIAEQKAEASRQKEAARIVRSQERRATLERRAKVAAATGKTVLKGVGLAPVVAVAVPTVLAAKGARAAAGYAGEKSKTVVNKVDERIMRAQANRAVNKLDAIDEKAAKLSGQAARATSRAVNARNRIDARNA